MICKLVMQVTQKYIANYLCSWYLHHVIGPKVLSDAGVNYRTHLVSTSPLLFFLGFWFTRPAMWQCGNMLVYRMKFKLYIIVQPVILLLGWQSDCMACRASAREFPKLTSAAFGPLTTLLRTILQSSTRYEAAIDPFMACIKVYAFLLIIISFLLPGFIIWYFERQTWRDFTRADPKTLTWEGGPSRGDIAAVQIKLRRASKSNKSFYYSGYDGRIFGIGFVVLSILWQLIDTYSQ